MIRVPKRIIRGVVKRSSVFRDLHYYKNIGIPEHRTSFATNAMKRLVESYVKHVILLAFSSISMVLVDGTITVLTGDDKNSVFRCPFINDTDFSQVGWMKCTEWGGPCAFMWSTEKPFKDERSCTGNSDNRFCMSLERHDMSKENFQERAFIVSMEVPIHVHDIAGYYVCYAVPSELEHAHTVLGVRFYQIAVQIPATSTHDAAYRHEPLTSYHTIPMAPELMTKIWLYYQVSSCDHEHDTKYASISPNGKVTGTLPIGKISQINNGNNRTYVMTLYDPPTEKYILYFSLLVENVTRITQTEILVTPAYRVGLRKIFTGLGYAKRFRIVAGMEARPTLFLLYCTMWTSVLLTLQVLDNLNTRTSTITTVCAICLWWWALGHHGFTM